MDSLNAYLTKLASDAPVPGGGSAAMIVGAAGCALASMVARVCAGSKKYADVHAKALDLALQADALRERMDALRAQDEAAFESVVAARGDKQAMQRALHAAAQAPLEGAAAALRALELARDAFELGNAHLVSDAGCAAEFAHAALAACAYNVRINHKFMNDESAIAQQRVRLQSIERDGAALLAMLRGAVNASLLR